jgi:Fe-S cluster biogenesis protein NfuA/nitrite reductase/ring-hydroxylating ferredoxin subunit
MERERSQELVTTVERLLEEVEQLPDPETRERTTEVVRALLELYGAGLERIVEQLAARDEHGDLARALTGDELVSHLLLLHGLHPVALEQRVLDALEEVRPYLESHGGNVELLSLEDGVARLRLEGSCSGCPSSTMTLKLAIENAIRKAAPEVEEVLAEGAVAPAEPPVSQLLALGLAEGAVAPAEPPGPQLLQLEFAGPGPRDASAEGSWTMAGGMPELADGDALVKPVAGQPILFLRLAGSLYGYRPTCPACDGSLGGAALEGPHLSCPACGVRYDARHAGSCLDVPELHLQPVPLLISEDGLAKVALASAV